jgi:thiamine biosynthesis lipoprotein
MLRLATFAMGTRFELLLDGQEARRLRAAGEAALGEIEDCDRRLSLFRRDSLLAHVNREAATAPVRLDQDTYELLETCLEIHRASGGAFDVTVAPLMGARGFHPASPPHGTGPVDSGAIELDRRRRTVRFRRPGLRVDLGAIGKGHALDLAIANLREHRIACGLLHGGTSTVFALGSAPSGAAWSVALEAEGGPVAHLEDRALSVSAAHGRTLRSGAGHVLDPRTGESAPHTLATAVVAARAVRADAWSTALLARWHVGATPPPEPDLTAAIGVGARGRRRWRVSGARPEVLDREEHRALESTT